MKQLTLNNVLTATDDEPKTIGERLEALGIEKNEFENKFSRELLNTPVYGSSFLKFLNDNRAILEQGEGIPAEPLPKDFKNPFEEASEPVSTRLFELGMSEKEAKALFADDVLRLSLTGREFQDFIFKNQDKFLGELERLALQGGNDGGQ